MKKYHQQNYENIIHFSLPLSFGVRVHLLFLAYLQPTQQIGM